MMTELDVVNAQLATMAEAPVTSLNIRHPFIAAGLNKLALASQSIQSQRWWFNCITIEVTPAAVTYLVDDQLPLGYMQVWSKDPHNPVTLRDGQLLALKTSEVITVPTEIVVHFEVAFRDLPVSANLAVAAQAIVDFQTIYDGDSTKTIRLDKDADKKLSLMTAEHMRVVKTNLLTRATTGYARWRARGPRSFVVN